MVDHFNSILVKGIVSKEPIKFVMKSGGECGRFEIEYKKEYNGNVKTQKYTVVTYNKDVMDILFPSIRIGATVAVNGEHACVDRINKEGDKYVTSEITVPSIKWGGAIRILENTDEKAAYSAHTASHSSTNDVELDDVPF